MSWIRTFLPSLHCHSHISHSFPLPWLLKEPLTLFPGPDCCALIILSQIGRWTYTSINQTVLFIHSNFQCLPTSLRPKPCISLNNLPLFLSSQSATCHPLPSSFSSSHAIFSTSPQLNQTVPALGFWGFFLYSSLNCLECPSPRDLHGHYRPSFRLLFRWHLMSESFSGHWI